MVDMKNVARETFLKVFAITVVMLTMFISPSFARDTFKQKSLDDSTGALISAKALTSGVVVYSETLNIRNNSGAEAILLILEDKPGGAGDVDISAEYSFDGTNWYTVYTTNLSGTISAEGNIVTALQNATRYITHTIRLGNYMRYKFDPDADSRITAYFAIQEEN